MSLTATLREFFVKQGSQKTYWIAYSGGMDSHVLLSLCADLRAELSLQIYAIHVNHHLSKHAEVWSKHCTQICETLQIPITQLSLNLNLVTGDSLEEVARERRYKLFTDYINDNDVLLTAHHLDDQAETLLIQLMRGAGPKGLAAMPQVKVFSKGLHARPLLEFSRDELLQYATEKQLQWIEDESNSDTTLTRNFVRHSIFPLMSERSPGVLAAISRSAKNCADTQEIADEYIQVLLSEVVGSKQNLLSVSKLLNLSEIKQRMVIREWIRKSGFIVPNSKKLGTITKDVLNAKWDRMPLVAWGEVELRRYRDDLYLVKMSLKQADSFSSEQIENVRVCFRDAVVKEGLGETLKKLFQTYGVPPWERANVPVLMTEGKIVGIVGYYLEE